MAEYRLTIPEVQSWQRARQRLGRNGKPVFYKDARSQAFADEVAILSREAIPHALVGFYAVKVVFYTKGKRNLDADRVLNGVLDGLVRGGRVPDDRRCWQQSVERVVTEREERIEVIVRPMEPRIEKGV